MVTPICIQPLPISSLATYSSLHPPYCYCTATHIISPSVTSPETMTDTSCHPNKRLRINESHSSTDATSALDSSSSSSMDLRNAHILYSSLSPVRLHFHSFLSDEDAARVMRVSHSLTVTVLANYTFTHHVFEQESPTADSLRHLTSLYAQYRMRVTRLSFHLDFNSPLVDSTGCSLLPSSLVTLVMGEVPITRRVDSSLFESDLTADEEIMSHPFHPNTFDLTSWEVKSYCSANGSYNQPLPPGALPSGLRHLQFPMQFNQPLVPGSMPSTVTFLDLGGEYNHPLPRGVLPSSLTRLLLSDYFQHPLLPGDLPASLRQLHCGSNFNQPLECGSLPAQLKALDLVCDYDQPLPPGVLPSSLTHLALGFDYVQPLQVGSLPDGLHDLSFGARYPYPFTPGVLPTSLCHLMLPAYYRLPLQPSALPPHLHTLRLPHMYDHPWLPSVLPSSLRGLDFAAGYEGEVEEGDLPESLKWVIIPRRYEGKIEQVLPAGCEVHWYEPEEVYDEDDVDNNDDGDDDNDGVDEDAEEDDQQDDDGQDEDAVDEDDDLNASQFGAPPYLLPTDVDGDEVGVLCSCGARMALSIQVRASDMSKQVWQCRGRS